MSKSSNGKNTLGNMELTPDWKKLDNFKKSFFPNHEFLVREYKFETDALTNHFISKILTLAEVENHHPLLIFEWHKVTLSWSTHDQKAITERDYKLAKKSDEIFVKIHSSEGNNVA